MRSVPSARRGDDGRGVDSGLNTGDASVEKSSSTTYSTLGGGRGGAGEPGIAGSVGSSLYSEQEVLEEYSQEN